MDDANVKLQTELESRIRFEMLISNISARFVRLSSSEVDNEIERALKQILDFFGADRCGLLGLHKEKGFFGVTHGTYAENIQRVSKEINSNELFPWAYEICIKHGLPLKVSQMAQLPPEAKQDYLSWSAMGVKSCLTIPLFSTKGIQHVILMHSVQKERDWPEEYISRLSLLGEIFINALERRDAEYALKESEMRLNLAAESAGVGLWALNIESGAFWLAEKTREFFGFSQDEEITYKAFLEVVYPNDRERIHQAVNLSRQSKEEVSVEYRIIRPDGNVRWMKSRGRIHLGDSKESNILMGVSIDITDTKRSEEEIFRLRAEYTHIARVSAMGELAASLAHELKQPLAAIRSNAQAALRFLTGNNPDLDELHEVLKDIIADNRRADDVIGKLRTLMRKSKPQIKALDMKELLQDTLSLLAGYEAMRKVSLHMELDEALPPIAGDRVQIQQVILNLILNSTEALMNIKEQLRLIAIRAYPQNSRMVLLSVRDNGPGIDPQAMPHLFEAFYTTKQEGLGMGLAISRSIVEDHGGRLWAENNLDGGAIFYFTIPIAKENLP